MAVKKSQLYSTIWSLCDDLRGGVDPADYKYYILTLLFVKYLSDKAQNDRYTIFSVPKGAGFDDMLALRNKSGIGDGMNRVVQRLAEANRTLGDFTKVDFDNKDLGDPDNRVKKLTRMLNTINDKLDLTSNHAGGDDLLGDAYEYLMRKFAAEAGKNKGQFYTPAEVSRLLAIVCGIARDKRDRISLHDPTCGSGSLLLRAAEMTKAGNVIIAGQEFDPNTATLARMNMVLHGCETADVRDGDTLGSPYFTQGNQLKTFDYVVANPPFSQKNWLLGLKEAPAADRYRRFEWGEPPATCGDYAFLLHIIATMAPRTGRGACIMPHGVLTRGNSEAVLRKALVKSGYIKAIIGLPANLFYGTGIPACILVLDKGNAAQRKGIYMIEASKGFMKDGAKNRLRERDLRRIADAFDSLEDIPRFARMVPLAEIEANGYNLNLPRYIDTVEDDELQDIEAHLHGGIPMADVDKLEEYRGTFPQLLAGVFQASGKPGYAKAGMLPEQVHRAVLDSPEYAAFHACVAKTADAWLGAVTPALEKLKAGCVPAEVIASLQLSVLKAFENVPLFNKYAAYQKLMEYYDETLRDDLFIIRADGWKAEPYQVIEENKKGQKKEKGWTCDLLPPEVLRRTRFKDEAAEVDALAAQIDELSAAIDEIKDEQETDGGYFDKWDKVNKQNVNKRLKAIKGGDAREIAILQDFVQKLDALSAAKKAHKTRAAELDDALKAAYTGLKAKEICSLVVEDKWVFALRQMILAEVELLAHAFSSRVKELLERYQTTLPELQCRVDALQAKVYAHLKDMGFSLPKH